MDQVRMVWDESFAAYNFGPGHPMAPIRLELTTRLARDLGVLDAPGVRLVSAQPASEELLRTVHCADYIAAVKDASREDPVIRPGFGLGTSDVPVFPDMHEAGARIVQASTDVALAVWQGQGSHGVNITGGLHHAMSNRASGFCVYNDIAVAIRQLLAAGAQRVAYVDIDAHHGDGVEKIFYDDPRVLTISLHESGKVLFPGTGEPTDIGGPGAQGSAVNVALPPRTKDAQWLRAFHAIVPPLLRAFAPQVLVTQHGCDSHLADPLTNMALSLDGQRLSYEALHELAHEVCDGRWVALGGGGYDICDVVPRAWTHLLAIAAHAPIPPPTPIPQQWQRYVRRTFARLTPPHMTDGIPIQFRHYVPATDSMAGQGDSEAGTSVAQGAGAEAAVDRAITETRNAVFPLHHLSVLTG